MFFSGIEHHSFKCWLRYFFWSHLCLWGLKSDVVCDFTWRFFFSPWFHEILLLWIFDARLSSADATALSGVDSQLNWAVLWRYSKIKTFSWSVRIWILKNIIIWNKTQKVSTKILILLKFEIVNRCLHFVSRSPKLIYYAQRAVFNPNYVSNQCLSWIETWNFKFFYEHSVRKHLDLYIILIPQSKLSCEKLWKRYDFIWIGTSKVWNGIS